MRENIHANDHFRLMSVKHGYFFCSDIRRVLLQVLPGSAIQQIQESAYTDTEWVEE